MGPDHDPFPQPPPPGLAARIGRVVLRRAYHFYCVVSSGHPPLSPEQIRQNREDFLRAGDEVTFICLVATVVWLGTGLVVRIYVPALFPAVLEAATVCLVSFWGVKVGQIVLIRRRRRLWKSISR
jgi:hypothetical protein